MTLRTRHLPEIVPESNETCDADQLQDEYWQYEVVDDLRTFCGRWWKHRWTAILTSRHAEYLNA